jgi:hypothetical protein
MQKNAKNYKCKTCSFISSNKTNYKIHLATKKHKKETLEQKRKPEETEKQPTLICSTCNINYSSKSGLWKHLKKYHSVVEDKTVDPLPEQEKQNTLKLDTATVLEIIKQNQEFKTLILEQQNKIIELSTKPNTVNNTTSNSNNTNNNTNTFNLQFFLNETCKDAMNITEFIQNLNIQLKELENVGNNGYVSGISEIILSRIKGLEVSKRPLHCTDVKRETMYIRDENEWNKDTEEKTKLRQMIGQVAKENMRKIPEWREQNPECMDMHDKKYEYCMQIMRNSLGDLDEKQDKMDEKIIKNIAKQVSIDKNTITYENN